MDITVDINDYTLNVRACAIIIHNNKILVHRNINKNHYALLGGRVSIGESSDKTVKREIQEELGKEVELIKYLTTIENFFEINSSKYHEILFIYLVDFTNLEDRTIEYPLENAEGKKFLQYEWLDINTIENYTIVPSCIKDLLKNSSFPPHKINNM